MSNLQFVFRRILGNARRKITIGVVGGAFLGFSSSVILNDTLINPSVAENAAITAINMQLVQAYALANKDDFDKNQIFKMTAENNNVVGYHMYRALVRKELFKQANVDNKNYLTTVPSVNTRKADEVLLEARSTLDNGQLYELLSANKSIFHPHKRTELKKLLIDGTRSEKRMSLFELHNSLTDEERNTLLECYVKLKEIKPSDWSHYGACSESYISQQPVKTPSTLTVLKWKLLPSDSDNHPWE